jgi:predicted nucleotidyltransferase
MFQFCKVTFSGGRRRTARWKPALGLVTYTVVGGIVVRRYDSLISKREQILAITARYGARNVRVFGSVVRGEDGPESDVDLLVEFEPGRGLLNHAALIEELENLLGCKVDVASHNGLKPRIRQRVIEEAVVL